MKKYLDGKCYCPEYELAENNICIYCKTEKVDNLEIKPKKKRKK